MQVYNEDDVHEHDFTLHVHKHPLRVCESRALFSVPMPELTYSLSHPANDFTGLSDFQVDTVRRIAQVLQEPSGSFLLGDATGMGKGRVIARVLSEFARQGAGCIWVSNNMRLRREATRDFIDTNGVQLVSLDEAMLHDDPLSAKVLFSSYGCLQQPERHRIASKHLWGSPDNNDDTTYPCEEAATRIAILVLDECHILRYQPALPMWIQTLLGTSGRVLFCSATAASQPCHLTYLARLSPYGGFPNAQALSQYAKKAGVIALEVVATHLKARGVYLARFMLRPPSSVRTHVAKLTSEEERTYNAFVGVVSKCRRTHVVHLFVQQLITCFKTRVLCDLIASELAASRSVVVCIQHTGNASKSRGYPSACIGIYESLMLANPSVQTSEAALGLDVRVLPPNIIDAIVATFGTTNVALLMDASHAAVQEEIDAFQSNLKRIAVISRAGSTGISLHDVHGQARTTILAELPWSAEDMVQQLGRTHRAGVATGTDVILLCSSVPGELRYSTILARRLRALGACTHAQSTSFPWLADVPINARMHRRVQTELLFRFYHADLPACGLDVHHRLTEGIVQSEECRAELQLVHRVEAILQHVKNPPVDKQVEIEAHRRLCDAANTENIKEALQYALAHVAGAKSWFLDGLSQRCDVDAQSFPWTRNSHTFFPEAMQKRALTVLLCARRGKHVLGTLPDHIVDCIVGRACAHPENLGSIDNLRRLMSVVGLKLEHDQWVTRCMKCSTTQQLHTLLNGTLLLPIPLQETLLQLYMNNNAGGESVTNRPAVQLSVAAFAQSCHGRAAEIESISDDVFEIPGQEAVPVLSIHLRYASLTPYKPTEFAVRYDLPQRVAGVTRVCMDQGSVDVLLRYPDDENAHATFSPVEWDTHLKCGTYILVDGSSPLHGTKPEEDFDTRHSAWLSRVEKKRHRLPRELLVCAEGSHMARLWPQSLQRMLRLPGHGPTLAVAWRRTRVSNTTAS